MLCMCVPSIKDEVYFYLLFYTYCNNNNNNNRRCANKWLYKQLVKLVNKH